MSRPVLLAASIAFLLMLGLGVLFPVLPFFTRTLGLSDFQAGLLLSSYPLVGVIVSPLWGRVSDRVGRRPVMVMGLLGFALGFALFGLGRTFTELLGARLLGGLFSAAALPAVMAYVADVTPPDKRNTAMGVVGAAIGLGVSFGPLLGGGVAALARPSLGEEAALRLVYFLSSGIGVVTALGVALRLPESLTDEARSRVRDEREALRARGTSGAAVVRTLLPLLAFSFLTGTGRIGLDATLGFVADDRLAWTARDVGVVLFAAGLTVALVQGGLIRPLSRAASDATLMAIGAAIMGLGLLGVGASYSAFWLVASGLTVAVGFALLTPTLNAELSRAAEGVQGEAQGLNGTAQALSRVVGPVVYLALYDRVGATLPYVLAAGLCAIAVALALRPRRSIL